MFAITYRKWFYMFSALCVGASLAFLFVFQLRPSIDFTGGSLLEISYPEALPEQASVEQIVAEHEQIDSFLVRQSGDQGYLITMPTISHEQKDALLAVLSEEQSTTVVEERFTTIGPTLGRELLIMSIAGSVLVLLSVIIYVAYVFRRVSKPVSSWKYGLVTIIALVHDIIIMLGTFALLGALVGTEVDTLFVTALLVILGYSVNDSIVVLDRIRENLHRQEEKERAHQFAQTVGRSLRETLARSLNTSVSTLLALVALYIFGGDATKHFALALIVGIIAGAYSSICVASPMLVSFFEKQKKQA